MFPKQGTSSMYGNTCKLETNQLNVWACVYSFLIV